ncbi:alpha/beta hydrolase [Lysinibacillus antri]|uniref:Alpha/beta hydrolase n=2 Tax=Bacillaceae TaxID=186817 RepID=A0A3S0P777_9BACI|nr:alpha/beta hydrolase [Lysinibacillus antri]TSI03179.1 alpha/beta hydrolase [Lysinibacillus sp. BW-2-10]
MQREIINIMQNYYESFIVLSNNQKLSYIGYGDTNENTVIFLHGFGSSARSIHPDTKILDKYNIRFFALNRPGYGESDFDLGYSMEDYADWVNEFLMAKGIQKASLIGWSAGGLYSQVFTGKYPEKVTCLNLVSSAIPLNGSETKRILPMNWKMIRIMNRYIPLMTKFYFQSLSKKVAKNMDATIQESIEQMVEEDKKVVNNPIMQAAIIKGTVEGYKNSGIGVYYDALALCKKFKVFKNPISNIKVNIWQGGKDTIWTAETSNYLREKYPNSTYTYIDNAGHLLYLSQWDEILKSSVG